MKGAIILSKTPQPPVIPDVRLSAAEAIALANERYAAKRSTAAEAVCRAWLSAHPDAVDALHLLGVICLESGRRHEAAELLEQAVKLAPGDGGLHRNLGSAVSLLGRPQDAIGHFEAALTANSKDADAARNLGLSLRALGRSEEAVKAFQRALTIRPNFAKAARNLGMALRDLGRLEEAEKSLRRAVKLAPAQGANHALLGAVLRSRGKFDEALAEYAVAVERAPRNPDIWFGFGNLLRALDRHEEAAAAYRHALEQRQNWASALSNLAGALLAQGEAGEAEELARRAVALEPDNAELLVNLGAVLQGTKRYDEAIDCYRGALERDPRAARAEMNLATALQAKGETEAAVAAAERAVAMAANLPEPHGILANVLAHEGRYREAEACYRRQLALGPETAAALIALGDVLRGQDKLAEAIDSYRQGLAIAPDSAHAHANLGMALLGAGQYEAGWHEYEWRWRADNFPTQPRHDAKPRWDGADLAGKTILLHAEQGHGDSIQFLRYVPDVAALGAKVVLECHGPVLPLAATIPGVAAVLPLGGELPPFDCEAPLMSLPGIFGSTLEKLPSADCFRVPAERMEKWRQRWRHLPGLRVGLMWQGSKLHPGDRFRSIALSRFTSLLLVPGHSFVSLQSGFGREQIAETGYGGRLLDPKADPEYGGEAFVNFLETAAMLQALDLVITIDTAVAHLAGSLGRPTWLLLPRPADWRWLTERQDSPWYPSLRLFRQPTSGDWASVLGEVERALRAGEAPGGAPAANP
jgi:tetratricopeptide (TPR) repeat protein